LIYPFIVTVVAFSFMVVLVRQFVARRRPYQLIWAASVALWGGCERQLSAFSDRQPCRAVFQVYYIAGALLMAACLGLGSEYLLAPRRIAHVCASLVSLAVYTAA